MSPAHTSETIEHEKPTLPAPPAQKALPEPEPSGGGLRKTVIFLVIAGAVGFAGWKIHQNSQQTAAAPARGAAGGGDRAVPVTVSDVQQKTMPIYLTALGTVTAYNSVTIKSRVDGQLLSVNVREGQAVRKGQLLAVIDPAPYAASLAQAEGQLAKDQATNNYAKVEANRYKDLYAAGVVSKDSAQTQEQSAGQSAGSIQADMAAIQAAKVNVAYTKILSPIDGVVGLRQVDPGNIVHASDATGLLLVTQLHPISVIFTLPEDQLPQVQQTMAKGGKPLVVDAYDRSETTHLGAGALLTIDNQIDTTTGTAKVKAVFDNKDNTLFVNQFVNVRLILQQRPNAIVVPSAAISSGTQGSFVYVVKEGTPPASADSKPKAPKAAPAEGAAAPAAESEAPKGPQYYVEVRPVVIDLTEGSNVIIKSGLSAGEQVVTDGQEKLKNHSKVSPKAAAKTGGKGGKGGSKDAPAPADAPAADATGKSGSDKPKGHAKGQQP